LRINCVELGRRKSLKELCDAKAYRGRRYWDTYGMLHAAVFAGNIAVDVTGVALLSGGVVVLHEPALSIGHFSLGATGSGYSQSSGPTM
jgi:hypothetical protein